MAATANSATRSITIERELSEVFTYVAASENLPEWASPFAETVRTDGDDILVTSGGEERRFRLRIDATLGVVDFLAAVGQDRYVAGALLRIVPRANTSEAVFTLLRMLNESDQQLEARALVVERELSTLRERLIEGTEPRP
jgi:hypothetical protein